MSKGPYVLIARSIIIHFTYLPPLSSLPHPLLHFLFPLLSLHSISPFLLPSPLPPLPSPLSPLSPSLLPPPSFSLPPPSPLSPTPFLSPLHPTEAEGLESSESSFEEELPLVSKPKLQTRHSMLDNLDEHINKQQQQTTDEPPAKRIKREEENEVCRSACVKLWGGGGV